jgi:CheY-like chemotaxis protein
LPNRLPLHFFRIAFTVSEDRLQEQMGDDSGTKGMLRITVTDTGAGISPENQKKLFKEVVQFNPEKLQGGGGSGFGLFLCSKIVDVHGGSISVFSEGEGKGTTFTLELPMSRGAQLPIELVVSSHHGFGYPPRGECCEAEAEAKADDARAAEAAQDSERGQVADPFTTREDTTAQPGIKLKPSEPDSAKQDPGPEPELLVVDDSHLNRKMLIKVLKAKGYACEEAEDGLLALAKVKLRLDEGRGEYAAILMDFVMPNMDGPAATRELRRLGYQGLIYGVTGNGLQSDIDHFVSHGATAVLMKPFNWTEFQRAIANHSK